MLKGMWSELALYHPRITDVVVLQKREEDKIFQLLSSFSLDYEDLHSRILMNLDLLSLISVYATIQREEVCRKVMNIKTKITLSETCAYILNRQIKNGKAYEGKQLNLKCQHCHNLGHSIV